MKWYTVVFLTLLGVALIGTIGAAIWGVNSALNRATESAAQPMPTIQRASDRQPNQ